MKHYILNSEARARVGFTDMFVVKYNDPLLTAAVADNTAVEVPLTALALGDKVEQDVLIEVRTAWAGPADLTATASVGVVGDTTALTPTLAITTAGTGLAAGNAVASANQTDPAYIASTAINMIVNFTPDADSGIDEFTAGELVVWANISRAADRARVEG